MNAESFTLAGLKTGATNKLGEMSSAVNKKMPGVISFFKDHWKILLVIIILVIVAVVLICNRAKISSLFKKENYSSRSAFATSFFEKLRN